MKIVGTSMLPALQPNDLIVIEKKEINELCVGDVIIFFQIKNISLFIA